jgi:hypothetical protein
MKMKEEENEAEMVEGRKQFQTQFSQIIPVFSNGSYR